MFFKIVLFLFVIVFFVNSSSGQVMEYVTVENESVNLRTGPGLNYKISEKLAKGEKLTVLNKDSDWFEVKDSYGNRGWVFSNLLSGLWEEIPDSGWLCFRGDGFHSGAKTEESKSLGKIRWTVSLNSELAFNSSPIVFNGKIYIGAKNGKLFCIDEKKGFNKVIGRVEEPVCSAPAVKNNQIYFVTEGGILYSFDLSTKKKLWETFIGPQSGYSPIVDNLVYTVGKDNQSLFALNSEDGKEKWKFSVKNNEILSSPSMGNDSIYIGSSCGFIYCLNKSDGFLKWKYDCSDCVGLTFVSLNLVYGVVTKTDIVNRGDLKTAIYAIDANSGEKKWIYDFDAYLFIPTLIDNTIYTGDYNQNICALDMFTGEEKWKLKEDDYPVSSIGNGNVLYSFLYNGNIFALDVNLKKKLWSLKIDGIPLSPALFNGVIYVPTEEGKIYAIE